MPWLLFAATCLAVGACAGDDLPGEPSPEPVLAAILLRVVDGDTIEVRLDSGPITIRLHGIDAPERDQPLGEAATKALRSLVEGERLAIAPVEQSDSYGRLVAKVFVGDSDMNARMVDLGFAWAYRRHLRREAVDRRYCELEAQARASGRGLWTAPPEQWLPPWDFRARQRGNPVQAGGYATATAATCVAAIGRAVEPGTAQATNQAAPATCRIKGNISADGKRLYHLPHGLSYDSTRINTRKGERWFCTVGDAERAGWRAAFPP